MGYNKLTSLSANIKAIETAVAIHSQGRTATQEEKQVLAQYSGFGGIKDVLDLGTDKPLDKEVAGLLNRLLDALRTLAGGDEAACRSLVESIKSSVLTAFYTPQFLIDAVAAQIHKTFSANGLQMQSFLEPSVGIGGFLPVAMPGTRSYAFEKDTITGLVLSLLHEDATTVTAGFETIGTQELEHRKFDVIASNIPFIVSILVMIISIYCKCNELVSIKHYSNKVISYKHCELHQYLCEILTFLLFIDNKNE